jgi:DNA-binding CsgD family transcriptional regulator
MSPSARSISSAAVDPLGIAGDAFQRRAWRQAVDAFTAADERAPLSAQDLERLATAAYLAGDDERSVAVWVRAHQELLDAGDIPRAVRCAFWMILELMSGGDWARASGWLATAQRLLDEPHCDCAERGLLQVLIARRQLKGSDSSAVCAMCSEAIALGDRFNDGDLKAFGRLAAGLANAQTGAIASAVTLLDEAMVTVTTANVSPIAVGIIYCATIEACCEIMDPARAREWTVALSRWCDAQPDLVAFRGQCLVHRAEMFRTCGEWQTALDDALRACTRGCDAAGACGASAALHGYPLGAAFYEAAEIHRLRGRFTEAEAAYRQASENGRLPEPGLALLRLAQGRGDAAAAAVRGMLEQPRKPAARAAVLAACVEITTATGDVSTARAAAAELSTLAQQLPSSFLEALSAQAAGRLALAEAEPGGVLQRLRAAWMAWQAIDVPYEAARTRELIGLACLQIGDRDAAELEFEAARRVFLRLDASPDLTRLNGLTKSSRRATEPALTPREIEVIRLIATGKTNRTIAHDLAISERTVDRHVSNILTKLDLSSRAAVTAYAYQHSLL